MLFQGRDDAGRQLARASVKYMSSYPVILALTRGGSVGASGRSRR